MSLPGLDYLVETVRKICAPEKGCSWINSQRMKDLAPFTLEETHELIDALENNDTENLREELGDLLYHVLLYAQKAEDQGLFTLDDVAREVADKMRRRKTWVFGDDVGKSEAELAGTWERIKKQEKLEKGTYKGLLGGIPRSMPALAAAHQIQRKACKAGFRWENFADYCNKITEEVEELKEAVASGDKDHAAEEMGDVLFTVAITGWFIKADPELALRKVNNKFKQRFAYVEQQMAAKGLALAYENMQAMEDLWQEAKSHERAGTLKGAISA